MDWYFLFGPDDIPLAVFKTETADESKKLFCKLYRQSWIQLLNDGVYMKKEEDVPPAMWDEIHKKYKKLEAEKQKAELQRPILHKLSHKTLKLFRDNSLSESNPNITTLETEKYLKRH